MTSAPKSAKGKSTVTKSAIMAHIATARQARLARGVKANYHDNGAERLAEAIVRAFAIPTLTEAGLAKRGKPMSKALPDAEARREFATKQKARLVSVSDILGEGQNGTIIHNRPENNLHGRLASIAKAMGLNAKTFYPVRSEAVRDGEVPQVFIVRR